MAHTRQPWEMRHSTYTTMSDISGRLVNHATTRLKYKSLINPRGPSAVINSSLAQTRARHWSSFLQYNGGRGGGGGDNGSQVLYSLMAVNLAVFMAWRVFDQSFMLDHFTVSPLGIYNFRFHTLVTSAFSHARLDHLLGNMLGLYFFGQSVGQYFGGKYLLGLYLIGGVASSACQLMYVQYNQW
eukprot:CAMPEP_0196577788 /NCGR_PEP_ID=MMETSP1081-20130531/6799_1 /TAXON_ID=36882 /ORGANISM="Pyramimonas amylifera, Strain CCMP720" /LENGTH=183 /DNA_ID=CAMNT_0041896805 /DNA_START=228 /DNA_END=776 /DNA_ORIENTATION=+